MPSPRRRRLSLGKEPKTTYRELDPRHKRFLLGSTVTLITCMILFVYLLPFGYMAVTSVKSERQITNATILPKSVRVVSYASARVDVVTLTGADGDVVGYTLLPDGLGGEDADTLLWDGTWDALEARLPTDLSDVALYSAGSGRRTESGVSILLPGTDAGVLIDGGDSGEPLEFDGSESLLAAALEAAGYAPDAVALFTMPDPDATNPALALLRPAAAIDALVDPRLLPTRARWDGTFAGLRTVARDTLGVDLADVTLHIVADADGSLNGVGLLPPGGDPLTFVDPATVRPETIEWDGNSEGVAEALDAVFAFEAQQLQLRNVPLPDGTTAQLALLEPGPESSLFVDPDDLTAEPIVWVGRIQAAEPVLDFDPTLENYPDAWNALDFARRLRNTAFIAGLGMAGAVLSSTLVAYGLSRFRIPFKGLILASLVATIILPRFVTLVPTYIVYERIGWVGTWWPLIIPHFFANAYNVFLLRQFFLTIPRDLDEAAAIDGAGPMKVLFTVILPQAKGALLAVALFHFFFSWNDFLEPLLYLASNPDLQPISIGLYFFIGVFDSNIPLIQSGALLGMAVPILVFLLLQRVFLRGIDLSGAVK